jgi:hypothetical protein
MSTYKGETQFNQRQGVRVISDAPFSGSESDPEDRGENAAWLLKGGGYDNANKRPESLANASRWAWHDEDNETGYKATVHTGPELKQPGRQWKTYQAGQATASGATVREASRKAFNEAESRRIASTDSAKISEKIADMDKRSKQAKAQGYNKANIVKIDSNPAKGK